ncbi:glutaredoxin, partial [marine sediment metagenome]
GALMWLSIPVALFIGTIGAVSVWKAVYVDKRDIKCACVGGDSNVPPGVRLPDREPDDDRHGGLDADQGHGAGALVGISWGSSGWEWFLNKIVREERPANPDPHPNEALD